LIGSAWRSGPLAAFTSTSRTRPIYRIIEIWDYKVGFEPFLKDTLFPTAQELKIQREMTIMTQTLHNVFVPRIGELSALSDDAPGGPITRAKA
jgi:hypothetical protein